MHVALASFAEPYEWEIDDRPFEAALQARGARVTVPAWNDPTVEWGRFDACLIRTTWDYHQHHDDFLAWTALDAHQRLFNPHQVVRWNIHKGYLRELEARGVPCIPTVWLGPQTVGSFEQLLPTAWGRAFLKPVVGANASQTFRFFSADTHARAAAAEHADALGRGSGGMLQPYLASVETVGEVSAIFIDGTFCHGARKIPVSGDYRVQDDHGAADEPWLPTPSEIALASRVVSAAGDALGPDVTGGKPLLYARVDLLTGDDGRLLVTELELIEPSLFFRHGPATAEALAEALLARARR